MQNFRLRRHRRCQCDQMLRLKVAQIFPKLPNLFPKQFSSEIWMFFKIVQKSQYTWATFETKYFTQNFKNPPIWSHWSLSKLFVGIKHGGGGSVQHFLVMDHYFLRKAHPLAAIAAIHIPPSMNIPLSCSTYLPITASISLSPFVKFLTFYFNVYTSFSSNYIQCDQKKSPNVTKSCLKVNFLEK